MRPAIMEVDLKSFKHNIESIRRYVNGKELMPTIKANGYGTYINKRLDIIKEFKIVSVAMPDEGVILRQLGYNGEIFILNQPYIDDLDKIIENNLAFGLSSKEFLNDILNCKNKLIVHLEIETGMNRTGIKLDELNGFIKTLKNNSNIIVEGVYTHLSSADFDEEYTKKQLETFYKAVEIVKANFNTIKYIHSSASNGLLNYKENITNLVRPGIIMYGYESFDGVKNLIDIKPICKLKSKITFLKEVDEGESISYSRKYKAKNRIKVATVPIGYADGISRSLTNKGEVVINGIKAPMIGTVCMDSFMVDVSNIENVKVGDDVYIWDNENITLEEVADKCNTINYEIMCTISDRVPRVFNK